MWPFRKNSSKQEPKDDNEKEAGVESKEENDPMQLNEFDRSLVLKKFLPSHHYTFTHQVMRDFCQSFPEAYFIKMSSEQTELVDNLWEITCELCGKSEDTYFSLKDIDFHCIRINDYPTVLTIMPHPIIQNDAYFVAAVLLESGNESTAGTKRMVAYITLERAIGRFGTESYLLCAWNGPTHINFGVNLDTLAPHAFIEAAEILLQNHLEALIGESEAKKWSAFHANLKRNFASTGLHGTA